MDRQEALQAYCEALSQEREQYLYQQAVKKSGAATRGMSASERDMELPKETSVPQTAIRIVRPITAVSAARTT